MGNAALQSLRWVTHEGRGWSCSTGAGMAAPCVCSLGGWEAHSECVGFGGPEVMQMKLFHTFSVFNIESEICVGRNP